MITALVEDIAAGEGHGRADEADRGIEEAEHDRGPVGDVCGVARRECGQRLAGEPVCEIVGSELVGLRLVVDALPVVAGSTLVGATR